MRALVLLIAVLFTALLTVFTGLDIAHNGFNAIDLFAGLVLLLFFTGLIGALMEGPRRPPDD